MTKRQTLLRFERDDEKAPWDYPGLLGQMASVLWDQSRQMWFARCRNCSYFGMASDPGTAMQDAINIRDGKKIGRVKLL